MLERVTTSIAQYKTQTENLTAEKWLGDWSERSGDVFANEPTVLAYEAAVSVEEDEHVLVFKRCSSASSRSQRSGRNLEQQLAQPQFGLSFDDLTDFGWWSRASRQRQTNGRTTGDTILVIAVWRLLEPDMHEPFLKIARSHPKYCWKEEPDTLIYGCGIVNQDAKGIDVKQGDYVFVIEFSDMQALQKHTDDPRHAAMVEKIDSVGVRADVPFRQLYRTTGKGFGSRPDDV